MKKSVLASVYLWSNNGPLRQVVEKHLKQLSLSVSDTSPGTADYQILLITPVQHENLKHNLSSALAAAKTYTGKICLVITADSQTSDDGSAPILDLVAGYLKNPQLNLRAILVLDLYDSGSKGPLSHFQSRLCQAAATKKIIVSSSGKNFYFPTSVSDLGALITKSLFVNNTAGELYTAAAEPLTDLEVAYLIKKSLEKQDLSLDIDLSGRNLVNQADYRERSISTQAFLNWVPRSNFAEDLDQLFLNCPAASETEPPAPLPEAGQRRLSLHRLASAPLKPATSFLKGIRAKLNRPGKIDTDVPQTAKRGIKRFFKYVLLLFAFMLVSPLVVTIATLSASTRDTYRAYQQVRAGQEEASRTVLNRARFWIAVADRSFHTFAPLIQPFAAGQLENTANFIIILGHGQDVLGSVLDSYSLGKQLYLGLIGQQVVDDRVASAALRSNLIGLSEKLSQVQLLINQVRLPLGYGKKIQTSDLTRQINLLKSQINLGLPLLDLLAVIANNQQPQHYLVIVGDQNELRSTGGYLASYGLATVDQGKIIDFQAASSLSLNNLIEGKIEPPSILKQLLGINNWLFHDSNLDADFSVSAGQIAWFYQRFKGTKVDGVLAINLSLFQFLLSETDAFTLADGQVVTAENLNQLAANPAADGRDLITQLTRHFGQKIISGELSFVALLRALTKSITYQEINLWFGQNDLQTLADEAGLAGTIKPGKCHPQLAPYACRIDTLSLNEANFSATKLNYYLKRRQNLLVEITAEGEVAYTFAYDYTYPVPAPTNLTQDYKAYYQFYLPAASRNLRISLDGQPLEDNTLIQTTSRGLTKLEFSAIQAVNQGHQLVIKFTSPQRLDLSKPQTAYSLAYLKQAGTMNDQLTIRLVYPGFLQPRILTVPLRQVAPTELALEVSPVASENIGILFKNLSL